MGKTSTDEESYSKVDRIADPTARVQKSKGLFQSIKENPKVIALAFFAS